MYKTLRINIGKDLNFDEEFRDLYVKAIPVVYLPLEVQALVTEIFANAAEYRDTIMDGTAPSAEVMKASNTAVDDTIKLLSHVVADWNLQDTEGNPLPIPSKMPEDEMLATVRKNLPQVVLTYVAGKIMEDTGEIPPVNASVSVTPFGKPATLQDPKLEDSLATHTGEVDTLTS